jgi:hypothetical protein
MTRPKPFVPVPQTPDLLRAAASMLLSAADAYPLYHAAMMEVIAVPLPSGWASSGRGSDISDPTANTAIAKARLMFAEKLAETDAAALEVHGGVKNLIRGMTAPAMFKISPQLKALGRCCDCDGDVLADKDGRCSKHYQAHRRAKLREESGTVLALIPGSVVNP